MFPKVLDILFHCTPCLFNLFIPFLILRTHYISIFNIEITKRCCRSNSSILGQKKKNQRKARNKKRAQERRHSESELSEIEDRKERDPKTIEFEGNEAVSSVNVDAVDESKQDGNTDIFDLDI